MLKKNQRITFEAFSSVLKKSTTHHSKNFTIRFVPSEIGRASVVVSKKVAKTAVSRNRLKRKIRTALTNLLSNSPATILVYAKKGALELSTKEIEQELLALLKSV